MFSFIVTITRAVSAPWRGLHGPQFREMFVALIVMVVSGTAFYVTVENWSVVDSVYFCVMTLSTVGSTNMDYRSMTMDGEAMVTLAGWQSLFGFLEFLLLPGLCQWVEMTEQRDALLPPPKSMRRSLAGLMKLSL